MAATKKRKRKRTLSAAQKKALAKGRAKLAALRKKKRSPVRRKRKSSVRSYGAVKRKQKSTPKKKRKRAVVLTFNKERSVAKRKKRRSYRRQPRRRRSYYMGVGKGLPMKQIQTMLIDTAISTVGAIGGTMVISRIPVKNPRLKAFMPLIGGITLGLLARGKQGPMMRKLGSGLMIAGGLAVVKQFAPQFALAGEDEMYQEIVYEDEDTSLLGVPSDIMGIPSDLMGGQDEEDEFELEDVY